MSQQKSSVIILAAGFSSRMGQAKLSLRMSNGKTFLQNIVDSYFEFGCEEIIVVVNQNGFDYIRRNEILFQNQVKIIINNHPEWERFYSIQCGVHKISEDYPVFIHNVDNPYVNHFVLEQLRTNLSGFDFIKPVYKEKGGHPILINEKLLKEILSEDRKKNLRDFLERYNGNSTIVNDANILVNINSKEEL